jgi:hypothetical protein
MPSTSVTFITTDLSMEFKGFDKDNEMEFVALDKVTDREFIYYLSVKEVESLSNFLADHLASINR